jgi:hypothetical protein
MTLPALAVVFLAVIGPRGMVLDRQMSKPMPAASCEAAITHPAVLATYAGMTDPTGRQAVLVCMPVAEK